MDSRGNIDLQFFEKLAENGNSDAMYKIAVSYYDGKGVEQDFKKSMEWYLKAVEKGNSDAMYMIGNLYYEGEGVEQDEMPSNDM